MKKSAKKGRPLKKWDRREIPVTVKLTAEERERFEKAADASRKSMSDFFREALSEAADRVLGAEEPSP